MRQIVEFLFRLGFWPYILVFTVLAVIVSELLIIIQSYWLKGTFFDADLLIVGFITPAIDAFVLFTLSAFLIRHFHHLHKRNEQLTALFDRGDIMLFKWRNDANWTVEHVSTNVTSQLGFESGEFLNGTIAYASRIHPDDLAGVGREVSRALMEKSAFFIHEPYRFKIADGTYRWLLDRTLLVYDDEGNATHFLGYISDITKLKQNEAALKESELRWKFAVEGSGDGLWEWNIPEGTIDFSTQLKAILGYSEDALGNDAAISVEMLHPEDRKCYRDALENYLHDHSLRFINEQRVRCANGSYKWILNRGITVAWDSEGNPSRMIGTYSDIDERKKQAEALARSENELNEAQRLAKIGNWRLDLVQNHLEWSDEIYAIFEIDATLFRPTYEGFLKAIHPEDRDLLNRTYSHSVETGESYEITHRLLFENNRIKYVIERGETLYDEAGKPIMSRGTVQDVTRTHNIQMALLEAKHDAEAANRAKGAFLANMSHEIRTPLNGIIGLMRLLAGTELSAKQHDYLQKAMRSSNALLYIINDILDYSKIEAGKLTIAPHPFRLSALTETLAGLFSHTASIQGTQLTFHMDPELSPVYIGDELRISQILTNLIGNALKFTKQGRVNVRCSAEGSDIVFEVEDTGIGMAPEVVASLFHEFSQADNSITRDYGGSGLGLAITRQLVELMHGNISVISQVGEGSTFRVTLPLEAAPEKTVPDIANTLDPASLASIAGARVLVVDDESINLLVAQDTLEALGLRVTLASSGAEALNAVAAERYDLVLMDLQMPGMDGFETTRRIRSLRCCTTLPIVALSAAVMDQDYRHTQDAGMNAHLGKPIDPEALKHELIRWIKPVTASAAPLQRRIRDDAVILPEHIDGIDLDDLLARLGKNKKSVRRLLEHFASEYHTIDAAIDESLNDPETFRQMMHKIKGVAGNLSMKALQQLAYKLEQNQAPQDRENDLESLKKMITQQIGVIQSSFSSPLPETVLATNTLDLNTAIQQLLDDMNSSRFISTERIDILMAQMRFLFDPESLQTVQNALERFDYDSAKEVLSRMQKELL